MAFGGGGVIMLFGILLVDNKGGWLRQSVSPHMMSPDEMYETSQKIAEAERLKGFFGYGITADYVIVALIVVGIFAAVYFFHKASPSLGKSVDLSKMIQRYRDDYMNPQIVPELYKYCCNHELLSPIVRKHNAQLGNFGWAYLSLLSRCPVKVKGHFIPISAFFFANSLDYVLSKDALSDADILWLERYFGVPV